MKTVEMDEIDISLDIDALCRVLEQHSVALAILFGSHVRGEAHSSSDVDIAVEFEDHRPSDREYNDAFLGLGADLSESIGTDAVDVVDLSAASPGLAAAVFDDGVLLVGDPLHAAERRRQLTTADVRSPRVRFDAALARINAHVGEGNRSVPATGETEPDG